MKLTHLAKLGRMDRATFFLLTGSMALSLLFASSQTADAQGVIHLNSGDNYLFLQPTYVGGQIDEVGATWFIIQLGFSGDLFTPGDSLQIDVLSSPSSLTPLATTTVSNPPWTYEYGKTSSWDGYWNAANGAVRVTMLSGSVDVSSVAAITFFNFTERDYSYTIPEPSSAGLLLLGGAVLGAVHCVNRRRKSTRPASVPARSR